MTFLPLFLQGRLFKQVVLTIYVCGNIVFLVAFLIAINQVWNKYLRIFKYVRKYCPIEKSATFYYNFFLNVVLKM